jgi:hypothetical protein
VSVLHLKGERVRRNFYAAVCCSVLHSVLQCVAMFYSVLCARVALCCTSEF